MSEHQSRFTFRTRAVAALLTFDDFIVPEDKYNNYISSNDIAIASYVVEQHADKKDHTHVIIVGHLPITFEAEFFHGEFGKYPNIKRLRHLDDAYRAMAYCCKQSMIQLTVHAPYSKGQVTEYVLAHVWKYAMQAKARRMKTKLMNQYKMMKHAWFPVGPPIGDQYDSSLVVSENASQFFE